MRWGSIGGPPSGRTVGIDFETTGLDPEGGDRITQVGVAVYDDAVLIEEWTEMLNPQGRPLSPGAADVSMFSDEYLSQIKTTFGDVAAKLASMTNQAVVFAHRMPFEVRFWQAECALLGITPPLRAGFDTKILAGVSGLRGKKSSLIDACGEWGIEGFSDLDAHDALNDAKACAMLGHRLVEVLGGWREAWEKHDGFINNPACMADLMRVNKWETGIYREALVAGAKIRRRRGVEFGKAVSTTP